MSRTDDRGAVEVVVAEDTTKTKPVKRMSRKSLNLGDSQDLEVTGMDETPVELIPAIPEPQRLFLEYHDVCAWVSTSFGPPSLLSKATDLATGLFKKKTTAEKKPSHRQVELQGPPLHTFVHIHAFAIQSLDYESKSGAALSRHLKHSSRTVLWPVDL